MRYFAFVLVMSCNEPAAKPREPHWTTRPVVTVTGTTRSGTTFTFQAPDGMHAKPHGKTTIDYAFNEKRTGIRFRISEGCVEDTLEDMAETHRDDTAWIRRDKLSDGGFIASYPHPDYDDPNRLVVKACHPFDGEPMTCWAEVSPWSDGDRVREVLPLAEKYCLSLRKP